MNDGHPPPNRPSSASSDCFTPPGRQRSDEMPDAERWQCSECGTLIPGPDTRTCPNCGGINFYPLADEVPGEERGQLTVDVDVERALDRLSDDG